MHRRYSIGGAALFLAVALAMPQVAAARIHIDPNGPAGKQYGVPLDSTRGDFGGKHSSGLPGQHEKAPLFGQGITPPGGGSGGGTGGGTGGTGGGPGATPGGPGGGHGANAGSQGGAGNSTPGSSVAGGKGSATLASSLRHAGGGGDDQLRLAALIAALLAVGFGFGFAMRRFAAPAPAE
jgi:hypothetical protein